MFCFKINLNHQFIFKEKMPARKPAYEKPDAGFLEKEQPKTDEKLKRLKDEVDAKKAEEKKENADFLIRELRIRTGTFTEHPDYFSTYLTSRLSRIPKGAIDRNALKPGVSDILLLELHALEARYRRNPENRFIITNFRDIFYDIPPDLIDHDSIKLEVSNFIANWLRDRTTSLTERPNFLRDMLLAWIEQVPKNLIDKKIIREAVDGIMQGFPPDIRREIEPRINEILQ